MTQLDTAYPFDHLVVLMLENRSFDNLFGYLYENDSPRVFIPGGDAVFRGVAGRNDLYNDDGHEPSNRYFVSKAPYAQPEDMFGPYPNAGEFYVPNINRQIYGADEVSGNLDELPRENLMRGFVEDYIRVIQEEKSWDGDVAPEPDTVQQIMNCYPPEATPVLSGLARSFAISDAWFAPVPSATWPNRSFAHSGTSRGRVLNKPAKDWVLHHNQPTIFERLTDALGPGKDWRVYGEEVHYASLTRLLHRPLHSRGFDDNFRHLDRFYEDCEKGTLAAYSFLEPRMMSNVNDMHPPFWMHPFVASSVVAGEAYINEVYEAVRQGKRWDRTLLLIVFDEHGGLYDHVVPPRATPPDSNDVSGDFGFRFDRFGLRVPAIFVSAYIAEATLVRAAGDMPFDHTSIIKTLCKRWGLPGLTDRDRAAPDFLSVFTLGEPRSSTPTLEPRPYTPLPEPKAHQAPLGHLASQLTELVAAQLGKELPKLDKVIDMIDHFFHGEKKR